MNGTEVVEEKTVDATSAKQDDAKTWEVTFEAPKYNALGEEIAYTVTEAAVSGYKSSGKRRPEEWFYNYQYSDRKREVQGYQEMGWCRR